MLLTLSLSCAPSPPAGRGGGPSPADSGGTRQTRTVSMAVRYEVPGLVPKAGSGLTGGTARLFNAGLFLTDGDGAVKPYLATSVPTLNSDVWRVAPDGRMQVTYELKPGLTFHDGAPLTADDFAFAHRVYANPISGMFNPNPQNLMESIEVRDPQTFVISWSRPYPDAARLPFEDFEPLPRHLLQDAFQALEADSNLQEGFRTNRFFTQDFIGAGPFKLERWEPGSEIVGLAFDGH